MSNLRVAVLGGGLSGLTSAYYLHRRAPRVQVRLFEGSARLGGVIQTERLDGWLIEYGADCFSIQPPAALELCRELGIENRLLEPLPHGRRAMIVHRGQLHHVPEGFVLMRPTRLWQVFKSPLLSWRGKARLAIEPWISARPDSEDESLADFVTRRLGRETLDRLVEPLVAGIYTADAACLSMQATMEPYLRMEREHGSLLRAARAERSMGGSSAEQTSSGARYSQFRALSEGMESLFSSLEQALPEGTIVRECPVERVEPAQGSGRWRIAFGNGSHEEYDGVISALPGPRTAQVVGDAMPQLAEELRGIPYASSALVILGLSQQQVRRMPEAFGFVVPAIEGRKILAASFASHKFPGRAPAGMTLVRVFLGGMRQGELLALDDQSLEQIAIEELRELIGLQGRPLFSRVRRWHQAMPQYHVGHRQRVQRIEKILAEFPGLVITGNALHGVGVPHVVSSAQRGAERLLTTIISRHLSAGGVDVQSL